MKVHRNERPYVCTTCSKSFKVNNVIFIIIVIYKTTWIRRPTQVMGSLTLAATHFCMLIDEISCSCFCSCIFFWRPCLFEALFVLGPEEPESPPTESHAVGWTVLWSMRADLQARLQPSDAHQAARRREELRLHLLQQGQFNCGCVQSNCYCFWENVNSRLSVLKHKK